MELHLHDAVGIPKGSELCFRVGGTRRQVYLDNLAKPLKFPCKPEEIKNIKVDVLTPISHIRIPYDAATKSYEVVLDADDHTGLLKGIELEDMSVTFDVHQANKVDQSFLASDKDLASDKLSPDKLNSNVYRHRREMESQSYLEEHGLVSFIQYLVHGLMQERPKDPATFLRKQIDMKFPKKVAFNSGYPNVESAQVGRAQSAPIAPQSHGPQDKDLEKLLQSTAKATPSTAPQDLKKLEQQALQASERLREENAKLRETAKELKSEYEGIVQETQELQAAKKAKAWRLLPFKKYYNGHFLMQDPGYWNSVHEQFPSAASNKESSPPVQETPPPLQEEQIVSQAACMEAPPLLQEEPIHVSQEAPPLLQEESVDVHQSSEPQPPDPVIEVPSELQAHEPDMASQEAPPLVNETLVASEEPPAPVQETLIQDTPVVLSEVASKEAPPPVQEVPAASPETSKFALQHESLMKMTAPLLVRKDAWKAVEPVQDEVGSLATENEQLVRDLIQMREMIKVVRADFKEMITTLDQEGVA